MPLSSGIAVCAGPGVRVGATGAEKSRPSGPKWLRRAKSEWPGPSSWADQFGLAVNVMERIGKDCNSAQTQVGSEVKVYRSDKTYD